MRLIIICVLLCIVLSSIADVAQAPLPTFIKGTSSKFYLDEKAIGSYYFKGVNVPSFANISTDGQISCNSNQSGAWPLDVKVYDKISSESQNRQYILRVVQKPTQSNIWAFNTDNYYARKNSNPFRILASTSSSTVVKAGNDFKYSFNTQNGKGDLVFAFIGLPQGVTADRKKGQISGKFTEPGIYTLGCQAADQVGNSAEGFITITVISPVQTQLNKVQLENKVTYKLNLSDIRKQQVTSDKQLFDALAVVTAAKAKLANSQSILNNLQIQLAAAQAAADKAAQNSGKAKTDRQNAAERLKLTNKGLNNAQDQLNLALLNQAAAADNVIAAQDNLSKANQRFNAADLALKNSQSNVQNAQTQVITAKQRLLKAQNTLKNALKQFERASQDLSDAKDDLEKTLRRKQLADQDVNKAKDSLSIAQKVYENAKKSIQSAGQALNNAQKKRQQCLANFSDAKSALQQTKSDLGAAEWDLERALAILYQSQARKQAADRSSALALAQGATYLNGSSPLFPNLGGWQKDNFKNNYIIQADKNFGKCKQTVYPRFAGSAKIVDIKSGVATLSTGQQITYGQCTSGLNNIKIGAQVFIDGVVNVDKKVIQVYALKEATL